MAINYKSFFAAIAPTIGNLLGGTHMNRHWPPGDVYEPDKAARRWKNAPDTRADDLHNALSFFLTTGWPEEALDEFLESIVPESGWLDAIPGLTNRRPGSRYTRSRWEYGSAIYQLFGGYWVPKK